MDTPSTRHDKRAQHALDGSADVSFAAGAVTGRLAAPAAEDSSASYGDLVKLRRREQRLRRLGGISLTRGRV